MKTEKSLEEEIELIKQRNNRVELDKAWETSLERKAIIAILTYSVIVILFLILRVENAFVTAIIPSIAFLLSTMTLGVFKEAWMKNKKAN